MIGEIEVTGVKLTDLVHAAYNPSRPQGLGRLHFQGGGLTDDEAAEIVARFKDDRDGTVLSMDYVKGRSIKFHVRRRDGRLFIHNSWYDHSDDELRMLLKQVGLRGDLVEKARAERAAYDAKCIDVARDYLAERGGKCTTDFMDDALPKEVHDGLFAGKYAEPPVFSEAYKVGTGTSEWSAAT